MATFKEIQNMAVTFAERNPQLSTAQAYRQGYIDGYRDKFHYDLSTSEVSLATDVEIVLEPTFEEFWTIYDYKIAKNQARKMWHKLTKAQKEEVMQNVVPYVASTKKDNNRLDPRKIRMYPATFLNPENMRWEDEITNTQPQHQTQYAEPELTFAQQSAGVIGKLADKIRKRGG